MEKRLIIAVAISIAIIVSFQFLAKPTKAPQQVCMPCPPASQAPVKTQPVVQEKVADINQLKESIAELQNERYLVEFSDVGGAIKRICLTGYKEAGTNKPFCLANIAGQKEYIGSIDATDQSAKLDMVAYAPSKVDGALVYHLKSGSLDITKKYALLKDKYGIGLTVTIKNTAATPQVIGYRMVVGAGVDEASEQDRRLIEVSSKVDGKIIGYKAVKEGKIMHAGEVEWTVLRGKYFSVIMKPFTKVTNAFYGHSIDGYLVNGVDVAPVTVQPGQTVEQKYLFYAGPGDFAVLKQFGYGLDETVNYGVFGGISKFLIVVMRFFYSIVKSWGVAILLLAVFLNILTFPLTMKSFKSMQKMQELHPQMEKLKVQYKGNPQKLNQEIMELYKTYKINPLSGCLPMLLQMPIFFALYQALMKSLELRCASFLWIKDLSMPDSVPIPFSLPLIGNSIHILPLIMVAAMVVQQKMSTKTMGAAVTAEQREQQKIMLIMMPIMFGFIFYNMPSGLVLYWVTNTVLTVVEQSAILRKDQ